MLPPMAISKSARRGIENEKRREEEEMEMEMEERWKRLQ